LLLIAVSLAAGSQNLSAQAVTAIDLKGQSKNIDFSGAAVTKPFKVGTVLPAVCSAGDTFFKSDAPAGENLYNCVAANTWVAINSVTSTNTGPGGAELIKPNSGRIVTGRRLLGGEGAMVTQQPDTITVETDAAITPRYASSANAPSGPCQTGRDTFTRTGGFPNFYTCVDNAWKPTWGTGTVQPATCYTGELYFHTGEGALYGCIASNVWSRITRLGLDLSAHGHCFISSSCAPVGSNIRHALPAEAVLGRVAAVRVTLPYTIRLSRGMLFAGNAESTAAFSAAIYTDLNGAPGQKIADTDLRLTAFSSAALYERSWGTGTAVLPPNVYWIGFSSEDPAANFDFAGNTLGSVGWMTGNLTQSPGAVTCANEATGSGVSYTLPDTCGTVTAITSFGFEPPVILASAQ